MPDGAVSSAAEASQVSQDPAYSPQLLASAALPGSQQLAARGAVESAACSGAADKPLSTSQVRSWTLQVAPLLLTDLQLLHRMVNVLCNQGL